MARQTVQDILNAQRASRDRQYGALQDSYQRNLAAGNEYADQDYALQTLATALGYKLAGKYKSESPEMAAARVNDAEVKLKDKRDLAMQRIKFIADNSVNKVTGEDTSEWAEAMWESVHPSTDTTVSTGLVAEEPPVAPPESVLTAGPGIFNPSGITSNVNPGVDTQAQFANSQATKGAREERDAWLRSTNQSDPFRQTSVYGTPKEKDNQLWEMYRDSLNGNKTISTGNSKSTASGTSYIVRGN